MNLRVSSDVHFFSEALGRMTVIRVFVPRRTLKDMRENPGKVLYPCLYLLHGVKEDYTSWSRFSNVERYANDRGIAVVMPSGENSWYNNVGESARYFDFITTELTSFIPSLFPVSSKREDTFIAGLSMGGYGAIKALFTRPDIFCAGASLSGALDLVNSDYDKGPAKGADGDYFDLKEVMFSAFGRDPALEKDGPNDLFYLAKELSKKELRPKIYACCGTEDPVYSSNMNFNILMTDLPALDYTYEEGFGGHDWTFWETWIQRVLEWLPVKDAKSLSEGI